MKKNKFVFVSEVFLIHSGQKERTAKFFTVRGCFLCLLAVEKIVNKALSITNKIFLPNIFFFSK